MVILFCGIQPSGKIIHQLFDNFFDLRRQLKCSTVTPLSHRKINFRTQTKVHKLFLTLLTQLRDNLSLSSLLVESLQYLEENSIDPLSRAIFSFLFRSIQEGKSFAQSLTQTPIPFSSQHIELIAQGEANNQLACVLDVIIHTLTCQFAQKNEIKKKLLYPCFLLFSSIIFFHFLLLTLFPNILSLYSSLGKSPPTWLKSLNQKKSVVFLSDGFMIGFIFLLVGNFFSNFKKRIRANFLKIPFINRIPLMNARLSWLRIFSLHILSNTPLYQSFQIATESCEYLSLRTVFSQALLKIKHGENPSQALASNPLLPADWILTFKLGERNNSLGMLCSKLIDKESRQLLLKIHSLIALLEPLTLLILGSIILFLILALYAPLLHAYSTYS
jgi:type II secretory pathway component PulF